MLPSEPSNTIPIFNTSVKNRGTYLVFDVETTGLPLRNQAEVHEHANWPRVIQICWYLFDTEGKKISMHNRFIRQSAPIPDPSIKIHKITNDLIREKGEEPRAVWNDFLHDLENCDYIVAHNIDFDVPVIESELHRIGIENPFAGKRKMCTMKLGKEIARIPSDDGHDYKYPTLEELYNWCFMRQSNGNIISGLHNAQMDAALTAKIFFYLLNNGFIHPGLSTREDFRLADSPAAKQKNNFFWRIILPALCTALLFILTIFFIIIPRYKQSIINGKREMIRELTCTGWSILQKYEQDERNGLLTREQAQQTAISRINYLRYGREGKDYFWITDMTPVMLVHPYRPDLNGKDLQNFTDPHGKKLFVEFVRAVKDNGQGYVDYMWQWKDDSTHIVPKLSFVKKFAPWGWIIGTGIYIEDVKHEIRYLTARLLMLSVAITVLIGLLLFYITHQSLIIERDRRTAEQKLRRSREKYKTLVEATADGLLMIVDNKIMYSNEKISSITGRSSDELFGQPFLSLLHPDTPTDIHNRFILPDISASNYEAVFNNSNNQPVEVLLSVSSVIISGKPGKIITVKQIGHDQKNPYTKDNLQQLISHTHIGFIRILLDARGTVIFANAPAFRMLGFDTHSAISGTSVLDYFADRSDRNYFRTQLVNDEFVQGKKLRLKTCTGHTVWASVSLIVNRIDGRKMFCDGMIEDLTPFIQYEESLEEAIVRMQSAGLASGQIKSSDGSNAVSAAWFGQSSLDKADIHDFFSRLTQQLTPLIHQSIPPAIIGKTIAAETKRLTNRLIEQAITTIGPPPVPFAFIALGSEARGEQTLATDQDNAIVFDDIAEPDIEATHKYFILLATNVCNKLNEYGFHFCKGNIMAFNPRWCQPLSVWKKYFTGWIYTPEPQNLLDISIFFDLQTIYGDNRFVSALKDHIHTVSNQRSSFFYIMADNSLNIKTLIPLTVKKTGNELYDLKKAIIPFTMFARIYALYYKIETTGTLERLKILFENNHLSSDAYDGCRFAFQFLMNLRYSHQLALSSSGLKPNNLIDLQSISEFQLSLLKKCLSHIQLLHAKLTIDFKKSF